jgi:flavin reductase (DIM6/NTAB) family NADH-FMN oxidoreductase RutF
MTAPFEADLTTMPPALRYKLLAALVVPRPIALVTTVGPDGVVNAAPFSFFNVFSEDPALVVLGLASQPGGTPKDTLAHVRETGAFVVNLVGEEIARQMNICAVDFPPDISEVKAAGFSTLPGVSVPVPRIAEAPAALECRHHMTLEAASRRHLVIGRVVRVHARPGIVDPERLHVNLDVYKPVARLFGNLYARLGEIFELKRQSFAEWRTDAGADAPRGSDTARQAGDVAGKPIASQTPASEGGSRSERRG